MVFLRLMRNIKYHLDIKKKSILWSGITKGVVWASCCVMIISAPNLNAFDNSDRLETDTGRGKNKKEGKFSDNLKHFVSPVHCSPCNDQTQAVKDKKHRGRRC